jgi:PAS domain S-box-containing protein
MEIASLVLAAGSLQRASLDVDLGLWPIGKEHWVQHKETQYAQLVKSFGLVLNQYRLYSEKHPAARLSVRNFLTRFEAILASEPTLTLGFVEGRLIINDLPIDPKHNGVVALLKECERFHVESLIFEPGASEGEIISFFKLMASAPKALEAKGGFTPAFEAANFEHIRLGTIRYQAVGEEEVVVEKSEGDTATPRKQVRKIERMEEVIEYYLTGSPEEVTFDAERLSYEVEKRPKAVAEAMLRRAIHQEVLKKIVEVVEKFLKENLAPIFIEEGKDFSQPIYALAREFKKTLKQAGMNGAGDLVFKLERCGDTVKVEHMVKAYKEGDHKTLERSARLCRKGAREKLKERLNDLGVGGEVLQKIFPENSRPRRSRRVYVSLEELEELRRIRDQFEQELAVRVAQRTTVLEQERIKAVRERDRMAAIIRSLGHALIVVDIDGKIQLMNPAAEKLLRIGAEEGKGISIHKCLKEEHFLVLAKDSLRGEGSRAVEDVEVTSKHDETRQTLQASAAVIESEDGKIVGVLSVLKEVAGSHDELKSGSMVDAMHERRTASGGD